MNGTTATVGNDSTTTVATTIATTASDAVTIATQSLVFIVISISSGILAAIVRVWSWLIRSQFSAVRYTVCPIEYFGNNPSPIKKNMTSNAYSFVRSALVGQQDHSKTHAPIFLGLKLEIQGLRGVWPLTKIAGSLHDIQNGLKWDRFSPLPLQTVSSRRNPRRSPYAYTQLSTPPPYWNSTNTWTTS